MTQSVGGEPRSDFLAYHQSLAAELTAVKDRIRHLIKHHATDGAFKEAALRHVLRRHLPETLQIGTGFIVNNRGEFSSQIDLLIAERSLPTLFKDGDLLIVTPSAVRAIIETKTTLDGSAKIHEALAKIAACKNVCHGVPKSSEVFTGLFVYDPTLNQEQSLLQGLKEVRAEHRCRINSIAYGPDTIVNFYDKEHLLPKGAKVVDSWVCWHTPKMAPAYFLGDLIISLLNYEGVFSGDVWRPENPLGNRPLYFLDKPSGEILACEPDQE